MPVRLSTLPLCPQLPPLFESEAWRREKLNDNIRCFRKLADAAGIALTDSTTPIQPIAVGDSAAALTVSGQLKELGIMAIAIRPPTVPVGQSRIRITLMTDHTDADIEKLVTALAQSLPSHPPSGRGGGSPTGRAT